MSAILGTIDKNINQDKFKSLLDLMSNRGKDNTGCLFLEDIYLGHKKLDLDGINKCLEPLEFENLVIVFNGKVYNKKELKEELINSNYQINTDSDSEIVLKGYHLYKERILKKIDGMYAFAIYDKKEKKLFLSRDRFGVKPLYYSKGKDSFIFSSAINPILKSGITNPILSKKEIGELLALGPSKIYGSGIFKGIKELKPAHYLIYKKGKLKEKRYWRLKHKRNKDSFDVAKIKIRKLVIDSIVSQIDENKEVCTLLSGGLDSSIVTAIVSNYSKNKLTTYSIDYEDNEKYFNRNNFTTDLDRKYIDIVKNTYNTNHKYITITQEEVVNLLDTTLKLKDYPGMVDIDSSLYYLAKEISKDYKIVLSGEGADEIFGGYPWYYKKGFNNYFPWINNIEYRQELLASNLNINLQKIIKKEYKKMISNMPFLDRFNKKKRLFYINMTHFMTNLLDRKDRMTMGATIEARIPFANTKLVEYLWNLPFNYKYKDNYEKYLLKEAFKDILPKEIVERKKNPYPKTHHPYFLEETTRLLEERLNSPKLNKIFNINKIKEMIRDKDFDKPWYGQLMNKPQLIAYLYQIDLWLEEYDIKLEI